MTKKDFELIAAVLKAARINYHYREVMDILTEHHNRMCTEIADALATTHPRFDRARFLAACGVQS